MSERIHSVDLGERPCLVQKALTRLPFSRNVRAALMALGVSFSPLAFAQDGQIGDTAISEVEAVSVLDCSPVEEGEEGEWVDFLQDEVLSRVLDALVTVAFAAGAFQLGRRRERQELETGSTLDFVRIRFPKLVEDQLRTVGNGHKLSLEALVSQAAFVAELRRNLEHCLQSGETLVAIENPHIRYAIREALQVLMTPDSTVDLITEETEEVAFWASIVIEDVEGSGKKMPVLVVHPKRGLRRFRKPQLAEALGGNTRFASARAKSLHDMFQAIQRANGGPSERVIDVPVTRLKRSAGV